MAPEVPQTSDRYVADLTPDERRVVYDYVVAQTADKINPLPEFSLPSLSESGKTELMTREQVIAAERDAKRRRTRYRPVHTKSKNYSEVMREVISNQMTAYENWLRDSSGDKGPSAEESQEKRDQEETVDEKEEMEWLGWDFQSNPHIRWKYVLAREKRRGQREESKSRDGRQEREERSRSHQRDERSQRRNNYENEERSKHRRSEREQSRIRERDPHERSRRSHSSRGNDDKSERYRRDRDSYDFKERYSREREGRRDYERERSFDYTNNDKNHHHRNVKRASLKSKIKLEDGVSSDEGPHVRKKYKPDKVRCEEWIKKELKSESDSEDEVSHSRPSHAKKSKKRKKLKKKHKHKHKKNKREQKSSQHPITTESSDE